jgi:hypothetical protein
VKLQVELHCPTDLQTAKEIADRADTIVFQANDSPEEETASGQRLHPEIGQTKMMRQ